MSTTVSPSLPRSGSNTSWHVSGNVSTKSNVGGTSRYDIMESENKISAESSYNMQPIHRGIYLRPTVFMINGTATHLMEVLYLPNAAPAPPTTTTTTTASAPTVAEEPLNWWGYLRPDTPASLVLFDYTMCAATPIYNYMDATTCSSDLPFEGYTNEELVGPPFSVSPNTTGNSLRWPAAAAQLSESLRENRLSAPCRAELYGPIDRHPQPIRQRISAFLRGGADQLTSKGSVLLSGVEVALRAMLPGEKYSFIIMTQGSFHPPSSYVVYHDELMNTQKAQCRGMRCFYISIKLLSRLLREPILPPIVEKYIVSLPSTAEESHSGIEVGELDWAPNSKCMNFFSFFHASLLFKGFPAGPFMDAKTLRQARRAFFLAIMSASLNCHVVGRRPPLTLLQNGRPSARVARLLDALPRRRHVLVDEKTDTFEENQGESNYGTGDSYMNNENNADDWERPTDEDALLFLRTIFFNVPRSGATVSCSVVRKNPLTMCSLPAKRIAKVALGSTALPLWLDAALQTMQAGEEDEIGIYMKDESDGAFHCMFAQELRAEAIMQLRAVDSMKMDTTMEDEENEKEETNALQSPPPPPPEIENDSSLHETNSLLTNSPASFSSGAKEGGADYGELIPHDLTCRVILEEFTNVYDTNSFFFANPEMSMRTVLQIQNDVKQLFTLIKGEESIPWMEKLQRDVEETAGGFDNLPEFIREEVINIMPMPFGCNNYSTEESMIVKGIHKLNFAVLLLTFQVDIPRMANRGLSPVLMQQYHVILAQIFLTLGHLYVKIQREGACTLGIEACSASIAEAPHEHQARVCRASMLRGTHYHNDGSCDAMMARSLVGMEPQQLNLSLHGENDSGGADNNSSGNKMEG